MNTKTKRLTSLAVLAVGIIMICFSRYITEQVLGGKAQIASAEQNVQTGQSIFNSNPYTKEVGKELTSGAQRRIDMGKEEIAFYENVAQGLLVAGAIFIVAGAGGFFYFLRKG